MIHTKTNSLARDRQDGRALVCLATASKLDILAPLDEVNPDDLTPKAALELLYELRALLKDQGVES